MSGVAVRPCCRERVIEAPPGRRGQSASKPARSRSRRSCGGAGRAPRRRTSAASARSSRARHRRARSPAGPGPRARWRPARAPRPDAPAQVPARTRPGRSPGRRRPRRTGQGRRERAPGVLACRAAEPRRTPRCTGHGPRPTPAHLGQQTVAVPGENLAGAVADLLGRGDRPVEQVPRRPLRRRGGAGRRRGRPAPTARCCTGRRWPRRRSPPRVPGRPPRSGRTVAAPNRGGTGSPRGPTGRRAGGTWRRSRARSGRRRSRRRS